jgi:hypothetical protein
MAPPTECYNRLLHVLRATMTVGPLVPQTRDEWFMAEDCRTTPFDENVLGPRAVAGLNNKRVQMRRDWCRGGSRRRWGGGGGRGCGWGTRDERWFVCDVMK